MTAPKVDTIRRYCDSTLAVAILAERGLLAPHEVADLHLRAQAMSDAAYAGVYRRPRQVTHPYTDGPDHAALVGAPYEEAWT